MRRRRGWLAGLLTLGVVAPLAACASAGSGVPTLDWYINPDNGGQAKIARQCTDASGGRYRIRVELLPRDAASQREQLARRLAAHDSSVSYHS